MKKTTTVLVLLSIILLATTEVNAQDQIGHKNSYNSYRSITKINTSKAVKSHTLIDLLYNQDADQIVSVLKEWDNRTQSFNKIIRKGYYIGRPDEIGVGLREVWSDSVGRVDVELKVNNSSTRVYTNCYGTSKYALIEKMNLNSISTEIETVKDGVIFKPGTYNLKKKYDTDEYKGTLLLKKVDGNWRPLWFVLNKCFNTCILSYGEVEVGDIEIDEEGEDIIEKEEKKDPPPGKKNTLKYSKATNNCLKIVTHRDTINEEFLDTEYKVCRVKDGEPILREYEVWAYELEITKDTIPWDCNDCVGPGCPEKKVIEKSDCPNGNCFSLDSLCVKSVDLGLTATFQFQEIMEIPMIIPGTPAMIIENPFFVSFSKNGNIYHATSNWGNSNQQIPGQKPDGIMKIHLWYDGADPGVDGASDVVDDLSEIDVAYGVIDIQFIYEDGSKSEVYSFETDGTSTFNIDENLETEVAATEDRVEYSEEDVDFTPIFAEIGTTFGPKNGKLAFELGYYHIFHFGSKMQSGSIYGGIGSFLGKNFALMAKLYAPTVIYNKTIDEPQIGFKANVGFGVEARFYNVFSLALNHYRGEIDIIGKNVEDNLLKVRDENRWTFGVIFHIGTGRK